jgi:hypothetical protein
MKHEIKDLLKVQGRQYDVYQYVTLFEQAEKAEQAIKQGREYTTPDYYSFVMCATFGPRPFPEATKHSAGFYYLIH